MIKKKKKIFVFKLKLHIFPHRAIRNPSYESFMKTKTKKLSDLLMERETMFLLIRLG